MSNMSLHTISAVVAVRDGQVLLQKGAYRGLEKWWSVPEDDLKFGEDPEECARRVLRDQANVKVKSIQLSMFSLQYTRMFTGTFGLYIKLQSREILRRVKVIGR
jgi:ADP-ribose pyrophosphatase YjhB (NUDIX family)